MNYINEVTRQKNLFIEELHDYKAAQVQTLKADKKKRFPNIRNNESLNSNLKLGHKILEDTKKAVPFSANYLARNRQVLDKRAAKQGIVLKDLTPIVNEAIKRLNASRNAAKFKFEKVTGSQFTRVKILSKKTSAALIGNCGELAQVALFKGMDIGAWNIHLDKVYIKNGDHALYWPCKKDVARPSRPFRPVGLLRRR